MTKEKREDKVGFGRLLIWQSRAVSVSIVTLMFAFLQVYCTDTLQLPPLLVSAILVSSKVLDGVTDAFAGFIVDKTKTKWGKARPYEIFIIGIWLTTWLMFSCPESLGTAVKCAWVFIMYALANSICYTFLNANNTPYMVRAFRDKQIVKLTSYGSVITMLVAVAFNIAFPVMMGRIATSAAGWSRLIAMWAVPMAAVGILRMIFIKEKYEVDAAADAREQLRVRDIGRLVKSNRYVLILALMNFIFNFVCNMGVITYYYKYIVNNVELMGVTSMATIVAIPLAFLFPKLIEKFSVVKLMIAGFIISAAGYLLNFFAGANIAILLTANILTGAGTVPASMLLPIAIIECADFNEWKGIHRMEGTMSSLTGLAAKVGSALGAGALGVLLQISGYTGAAETMPSSAVMMIRLLFSLIPMVLFLLTALSLKSYNNMNKMLPQIREENQKRREEIQAQKPEESGSMTE